MRWSAGKLGMAGTFALSLLGCREDSADRILPPPPALAAPAPGGPTAIDAAVAPPACAHDTSTPARTLACTGLYADIAGKRLAPGVESFAPAVPLWSDGADKIRWIYLPPGTRIDTSNRNEWIFPVGTKAWKEFSAGGRRIETRLWQKVRENFWVKATYAWDAAEAAAEISAGGDVALPGGGTYHIPTADECMQCHRGRRDFLLGFEAVSLGLPGATGVTLADLLARDRLTRAPSQTRLTIGDDGTGAAAAPLAWMHINCGTTCHNDNSNAVGYPARMLLRLDPDTLDGRSALLLEAMKTIVAVPARAPRWQGATRVVPGEPMASLLFQLISTRGIADQMPPIATRLVDVANDALMADWIRKMPRLAAPDAGSVPDAGPADAGTDADADAAPDDAATDLPASD